VPEAETKVHHVFLGETAGLSERANVPSECLAESWEVQGHRMATLCGGGHLDHGLKCRKHSQGLRRSPNGGTMAACLPSCASPSFVFLWHCPPVAVVGVKAPAHKMLPSSRAAAAALPEWVVAELVASWPRPPAPRLASAFPAPASPARALPASRAPKHAHLRGSSRRVCAQCPGLTRGRNGQR
jgi:hypothetical protein